MGVSRAVSSSVPHAAHACLAHTSQICMNTSHLLTVNYKTTLLQLAYLGFEPDDTSSNARLAGSRDKASTLAPPFPSVKRAVRVIKRSGLYGEGKASSALASSRRIHTCLVVGDATAQDRLSDALAEAHLGPVLPLEEGRFAVVGAT